jgi:hypothetical protein
VSEAGQFEVLAHHQHDGYATQTVQGTPMPHPQTVTGA